MFILYETVARQQKATLSVPAVAVTSQNFKPMYKFSHRNFHKCTNSLYFINGNTSVDYNNIVFGDYTFVCFKYGLNTVYLAPQNAIEWNWRNSFLHD